MFKDLDPLLHSQLRLSVMSILMTGEADFNYLKTATGATSGNLSIQIKKLQDAGYIEVVKSFRNNYQNTSMQITGKGIKAFENYVEDLRKYIEPKK